MVIYSHAILWLFLKQKKIRIAPLGGKRLKGLELLSVLRCDFLKHLMTVPVLSVAPVPQQCRRAGSELDHGMTWLERQMRGQCGLAKIPAGTSLGVT